MHINTHTTCSTETFTEVTLQFNAEYYSCYYENVVGVVPTTSSRHLRSCLTRTEDLCGTGCLVITRCCLSTTSVSEQYSISHGCQRQKTTALRKILEWSQGLISTISSRQEMFNCSFTCKEKVVTSYFHSQNPNVLKYSVFSAYD